MLDEAELRQIAQHGMMHDIGLCTCPCFDALMRVGEAVRKERELAAKIGEVSPMALAALMGADLTKLPDDDLT